MIRRRPIRPPCRCPADAAASAAAVLLILAGACAAAGPGSAGADDVPALLRVVRDSAALLPDREAAVQALAGTRNGGLALLQCAADGGLAPELDATARFALAACPDPEARAQAARSLPVPRTRDDKPVPALDALVAMPGDAARGAAVFRDAGGPNCISCHEIGREGRLIGPPLTTIGDKLTRRQLYESILTPSASILMSYETWVVRRSDETVATGLLVEDTPDHVTLKDAGGGFLDIPAGDVAEKQKTPRSLMPDDLVRTLTLQDLVDAVEYLSQRKTEGPP